MARDREVERPVPPGAESPRTQLARRGFLQMLGAGAGLGAALGVGLIASPAAARPHRGRPRRPEAPGRDAPGPGAPGPDGPGPERPRPDRPRPGGRRASRAFRTRVEAARLARPEERVVHRANGEEQDYPYVASFSKGLPHDGRGDVLPEAYQSLLRAVEARRAQAFEEVQLGLGAPLVNPAAGLAFDLEGPDAQAVTLPPAPRIDGPQAAGELAEVYWMALARDVSFVHWRDDATTHAAAEDLSRAYSDFRGPREGERVTPATLFRGTSEGCLTGPYLSQLLWRPVRFGALTLEQRMRTTLPGSDHLTDVESWLAAQDGARGLAERAQYDPEPRYVRCLRDMAEWVHVDVIHEAYFLAALGLLGMGAPYDPGVPLQRSRTQEGFVEWGEPHLVTLLSEVPTRALKAVWYQKWFVHRRLRPEELAGRVHQMLTGAALFPVHGEILEGEAAHAVARRTGTHLLPMAAPEGCPLHPSYGAGHATVAGACTTILKAWFDGETEIPEPVIASADGRELLPWRGEPLRVGGELDKLAWNISLARNAAGFHWRSDDEESLVLGERVALQILREHRLLSPREEPLRLRSFRGELIEI